MASRVLCIFAFIRAALAVRSTVYSLNSRYRRLRRIIIRHTVCILHDTSQTCRGAVAAPIAIVGQQQPNRLANLTIVTVKKSKLIHHARVMPPSFRHITQRRHSITMIPSEAGFARAVQSETPT